MARTSRRPLSTDWRPADGPRYANFHVTPLCSPTRTCLLTGRNHHSVGMGRVAEMMNGFPNTRGFAAREAANLAEMLRPHGYQTPASGKWHQVSINETSPAGSCDHQRSRNGFGSSVEENLARLDDMGGPLTYNHYPFGWAMAGNTPFKRCKGNTYAGGVRAPLLIRWSNGIHAKGETRRQFYHVVDVMPTLLDLLGVPLPSHVNGVKQIPLHGTSMAHTLNDNDADTRKTIQNFVNEPLDVGRDSQTPVDDLYESPFVFEGSIVDVVIEAFGREVVDPETLLEELMATQ